MPARIAVHLAPVGRWMRFALGDTDPLNDGVRIPWPDPRCILCCRPAPLTDEHVIPASIGGRLVVPFLCQPCNSWFGQRTDPSATRDPYVREAVLRLGDAGEPFKPRVLDGMPWVAQTTGGARRMVYTRKRGIDMLPYRDEVGALNLPTEDAKVTILRMLQRAGASLPEITAALEAFAAAPDDAVVPLGHGLMATKSRTLTIAPVFDGPAVEDLLVLKMAYELLALHVEELIFEPCFDSIRAALRSADMSCVAGVVVVKRLLADKQDLIHGLALEESTTEVGGHAVVHIRLFGRPTWRVGFPWLRLACPRVVVTQDLITGEIHLGRAA